MKQEIIEKLRSVRPLLAAIIVDAHPENDLEIETVYILCRAHDIISKIDPNKLGQLPLPEAPAQAEPPTEQLPLPDTAAVQAGEDSLNTPAPPALVLTADQEFDTIQHAISVPRALNRSPSRRGISHANT